jgi:hypothetical protein
MDPIGTVRREDHHDDGEAPGHTIWVRQDPGYPDSEMANTEWTCVWSTSPGNIGGRHGDSITEVSEVIGYVSGTPAVTAADVRLNDRVETLPGALYWTNEPVQGHVVGILPAHCTIKFDQPQVLGDSPEDRTTYTHWGVSRLSFRLLEDES